MGTHPIFESDFDCLTELKMDSGGMSLVIDESLANRAAQIIQRAWRCWVNKAPFKWCKAMLYHADKSDTAKTLLKFISPGDANMIDQATGVKVRLRLGVHSDQDGEKLAIFYKLFTSRPVIDLCASSPRQYTHANSKQPTVIHTKNKINMQLTAEEYYKRAENNDWRVVAWDALKSTAGAVAQSRLSKPQKDYNFSAQVRIENRHRRRKEKQRAWMSSLYMNRVKQDSSLQQSAAISNGESSSLERKENEKEDELVDWASNLNFDDYQNTWTNLITLPK